MSWRLLPANQFETVRDLWRDLSTANYANQPFLDCRFVETALQYFADDDVSIALHEGEHTTVALTTRSSFFAAQTFCPSQLPMALIMTDQESVSAQSLQGLLKRQGGMELGLMHYDAAYQTPIVGPPACIEHVDYAPTIWVDLTGKFDDYWGGRSKNLRRNISRYQNRAGREGFDIRFEEKKTSGEMEAAVTRYGDIESAGWKGENGTAIHRSNEQGRFYRDLMTRFAEDGCARVLEMFMNDQQVASRLVVEAGSTAVILKTTYDESFAKFAPGRLHLHELLSRLFNEPKIARCEFYTKAGKEQLSWASEERMIQHVNVYRFSLARQAKTILRSVFRGSDKNNKIDNNE